MSKQVRLRRGTTAQHSSFTGAQGEVTVDTDKKVVVVHDGSTAGGVPMFPSTGGTIAGSVDVSGPSFTVGTTGGSPAALLTRAAAAGTNGGAAQIVQNGSTSIIGIGNKSALFGGAYDATPTIFGASQIYINQGISVDGNVLIRTSSDTAATIDTTGGSSSASLVLSNGSGTTSAKFSYMRYLNNASSPQEWRVGTYGTDSYSWRNETAGTNPMTLDTSGNLALGVTDLSAFVGARKFVLGSGSSSVGQTIYSANNSYGGVYFADGVAGHELQRGAIEYAHDVDVLRLYAGGDARVTVDGSGNLLVGATSGSAHTLKKDVSQGTDIAVVTSNAGGRSARFLAVAAEGWNTADAAIWVGKNDVTNRGINSGGTINASGADYAEYEWNNGLLFYKGEIVGFNSNGTLTNKFSEAIRFAVKSTNPSIVGGDSWGNSEAVGEKPIKPSFVSPGYTGISQPEEVQNTITEESTEEEIAAYNAALAEYNQLLEQFNSDQETYQELVQEARKIFDEETLPAYEAEVVEFEERLEAARRMVDRIAYAGKVPCNVQGAQAGDYIIPTAGPNDSIVGISTNDPTFSQYKKAVGRVNKILEDGRAEIAVMIH